MSESTSAAPSGAAATAAVAAPDGGGAAPAPSANAGAAAATEATQPVASTLLTDPPVDAKPAEESTDGDKPVEEVKPAIEYADFALPEGLQPENETLAQFRVDAAELGLTQEQAQGLITKIGGQMAAAAQAQVQNWVTMNNQWQAEIKADPELGGANFEPMRVNVAKLFDDYVGPKNTPERQAFDQALHLTGAGNNPALVRGWARIAAAHGEGSHIEGSPARTVQSTAELLYPTHNQAPGAPR